MKTPDVFEWHIKSVNYSMPMTYTIDELEDYGVYYRTDASGKLLSQDRFIYSEGCLRSMSNDPAVNMDGRCLTNDAKNEGWYFAKLASTMPLINPVQLENEGIFKLLSNAGDVDQEELQKLEALNNSNDNENINLANAILKRKYGNVLDIQSKTFHRSNDS